MANISRITNNKGLRTGFGDNSGLSINQGYFGLTQTSGTVSVTPQTQYTYVHLTSALTGNVSISINGTYSEICDQLNVLLTGGSSAYVVTYAGDISSTTGTFSATANKNAIYTGVFNGSKFTGSHNVQS